MPNDTRYSPQPRPGEEALRGLADDIRRWAQALGFQQCGICLAQPGKHSEYLQRWLDREYHGEMDYMKARQPLRDDPSKLHPGTLRVISLRMDYLPPGVETVTVLEDPDKAYISRYALGADYHKLVRKRIAQLAKRISAQFDQNARPFVDSAPVLERAYAERAGLGWIGKNTMLINSQAGSWFFLGELFTDLPLPVDPPSEQSHCGSCTACLDICPTDAFAGPNELDARKCISYLTIELKGSIPEQHRKAMGNRVFGCDDCQLVCPWNKFAQPTAEQPFQPRHGLDDATLAELFTWSEAEFLRNTEGSAIRRIGYQRWLRNLAVGLGNSRDRSRALAALAHHPSYSPLVAEHVEWARQQLAPDRDADPQPPTSTHRS